jgi:CHAT domain-containing protein/Flp pilus assembly protein TadD
MSDTTVKLDEVLGLSPAEAIERLRALSSPAATLTEMLRRAETDEEHATRLTFLVATAVARSEIRPSLADPVRHLVQLLVRRVGFPTEPAGRRDLSRVLESIDHQLEMAGDNGAELVSIATLAELSRVLGHLAAESGDAGRAHALLSTAVQRFEQIEHTPGIVLVNLEIGLLLWHRLRDAAGAVEHLAHAADTLERHEPIQERSELRRVLIRHFTTVATTLHYEERKYPLSVRLAQRATKLDPDNAAAWLILGNGLSFQEQYEPAVEAFERLAELDPQEKSSARANLAAALVKLDRHQEALSAVSESLRLRPGEVRPLVLRGQLRALAGDTEGAIEDLESVIGLLEADKPVADRSNPVATQRYREHWHMWLTAYHNLLQLHRERKDSSAVESTLARLKSTGDDALMAMGYRISGDLARREGRLEDARREYDAALREFELDSKARLARATLAYKTGDADQAINDLALLTPRDRDPKLAIEGLNAMAQLFPHEPRIYRWLGFAHFELGIFEQAEASLDAYLEREPRDAEARRWLGFSLISINPDKHEAVRDGQRCFRGLEELAHAASDGDGDARAALLWVVDRLILSQDFAFFFLAQKPRLLDAVPAFKDLLKALVPALLGGRDYERRVAAFRECIAIGSELGLPCLVAYLHALLADVQLLLGNLQVAQEHIDEAQQLDALVAVPRSSDLRHRYDEEMSPELGDRGMEIEHLHIYRRTEEALRIVKIIAARVRAMAGDKATADSTLGKLSSLLEHVDRVPQAEAAVIAQTLRDAGRADDALVVLDRAEQRLRESDREQRASVLMVRATILANLGRLQEAVELIGEAEPLLPEGWRWIASFNLTAYLDASGEHSRALDMLDRFDIDRIARSDQDRFKFHLLRASSLEGCGRGPEALEAATEAISILESIRADLKDLDLRRSWAGQQERMYALAIRIAEANGKPRRAFDLSEQARSRLLVDEMAIGGPVEDEEGRRLREEVRLAEERHDLLVGLAAADDADRGRVNALVRLQQLDPKLDIFQHDQPGSERISPEKLERTRARSLTRLQLLREQIAEHRLKSADRLFGDVVEYDYCRAMLAEAGRVSLIEFIVQENDTLALLVRGDQEEPFVLHILEGVDAWEWAREFNRAIVRSSDRAELEPLQAPLKSLLDAIEEEVDAGDVICLAPHKALHLVPFHALQLASGRLIERNPVVYTPSASVLARVLARPADAWSHSIVVGNTRGDLPNADREARTVATLLGVEPIARRMATRSGLREALSGAENLRILHLACHGYFDGEDALSSGILTTEEKRSGGPAVLSARDLLEIHLHADLVVLSACESGISEVNPGDELMGLNRALLAGGTRTVLGSLWKVNDYSTSILMGYFYEGWLREQLSKAEALRAAQCRLMKLTRAEAQAAIHGLTGAKQRDLATLPASSWKGSDPEDRVFASPLHWAAFTLVGDWR